MAPIPESVKHAVQDYVGKIQREIPVTKAIIFGSFAKGDFDSESDIDLAIFSDHFESMSRVEGITYLLRNALGYSMDLEPIAFTNRELEERLGIVEEIVRTGIEVKDLL